MAGIEEWWGRGELVQLDLQGTQRAIFVVRTGQGPSMTLLHGYPSSSHDWARVTPALADRWSLLLCDFLGFGASDKPVDHVFSLHEQADLVEALWEREGIESTAIVAHDYAGSVTQELLARRAEGTLRVDLTAVHLLNGGLYPDLHRPVAIQTALLDPEQGPKISAGMTREALGLSVAPTVGPDFDPSFDVEQMWLGMTRNDGTRVFHKLIRYILDRREHAERWTGALESTDVPVAFVWGMLDPISGAHVAERIRERLPDAPFTALEDVSHWPPLEAPERVAAAVLAGSG